jgi:hypothetical protein
VYADRQGELTDKEKIDINNLNSELVHKLKTQDTAFSAGYSEDGIICVRFGLITAETDVEMLISLVHGAGTEVEESSKFLESMSELIRKGIDEANKELQKENADKLMHEGVLRQVPVVSSLLNWFSPTKEQVKGRTFNLTSGKIIPTTDTYKYHMQIQEEGSEAAPPGSPREHPQTNGPSLGKKALKPPSTDAELPASPSETTKTAGDVKAQLTSQAALVQPPSQDMSAVLRPPPSVKNVDASSAAPDVVTTNPDVDVAPAES